MKLISLPKNLKISFLYEDKEIDLSNYTPMVIDNTNGLIIETKRGKFKPKSLKDIVDSLSKYSCIFTYNPPGENDSLLSLLTEEQLCELNLFGKISVDNVEIRKMKTSMSINGAPIFNLIGLTKTHKDKDLDSINLLIQQVLSSRGTFGVYNLSSGASEARALITQFDEIRDDISLSHRLKLENLDKFNSACYGGRMESSGLGTTFQSHWDMVKAHLNILKDYPGIRDTTWTRSMLYLDSALPTSIYLIKTDIPRKFKYNPLPVKTESGIKYPNGTIVGWYYKDYLELLQFLRIPFKVLDSIQLLGDETHPFKNYIGFIRGLIKLFESEYPNLEYKHLYSTVAGSCKSIYRNITEELREVQVSGRTFNPLIYGFILARQNTEVYKQAIKSDADAIKMDAIACGTKPDLTGNYEYQLKGSGLSTYLTPALKSVPNGTTLYKDYIRKDRDKAYITVEVNTWNSLQNYIQDNLDNVSSQVPLGQKFRRTIIIKPHYGNRKGKQTFLYILLT